MSQDKAAWLFDLDGTLYRPKPLKYAMAAELLLLGPWNVGALSAFRKQHELLRAEMLANPEARFEPTPFDEQLKRAAQASGVAEDKLRAKVESWMIERPGKWIRRFARSALVDRLIEFHGHGGKTALVSDYPATKKLEAFGLKTSFDAIVANGEHPKLQRMKPAPDAFLLAAEELGVAPQDCHVIGDREDADGDAARAAGMSFELIK